MAGTAPIAVAGPSNSRHNVVDNGSVVLRVKRKRGTDPITALRIEALMSEGLDVQQAERTARQELSPSSPPLDQAFGTSPDTRPAPLKRQMTASQGLFQLAETVAMDSFNSAEKTRMLQDRIRRRIREKPTRSAKSSGSRPSTPAAVGESSAVRLDGATQQGKQGGLPRALSKRDDQNGSRATPQDIGRKSRSRMRVIDAVIDAVQKQNGKQTAGESGVLAGSPMRDVEMDSLDRRFADLLGDFLRDQDLEPPSDLKPSPTDAGGAQTSTVDDDQYDSESDYVYDIYYRVKDTYLASGPSGAADIGLRPASVAGRDRRVASGLSTPRSLAGPSISAEILPTATLVDPAEQAFFLDDSEEMQAEIEQGSRLVADERYNSDHPFDDGEDEDSNDEDFYKNEYPDDEAGDDDDDAFGGIDDDDSPGKAHRTFGWSGPRRAMQQSALYDSDGSGGDSDDSDAY